MCYWVSKSCKLKLRVSFGFIYTFFLKICNKFDFFVAKVVNYIYWYINKHLKWHCLRNIKILFDTLLTPAVIPMLVIVTHDTCKKYSWIFLHAVDMRVDTLTRYLIYVNVFVICITVYPCTFTSNKIHNIIIENLKDVCVKPLSDYFFSTNYGFGTNFVEL